MVVNQTNTDSLIEDSRESLQEVRRSLIELYASIGIDPAQPQEVARRLGLNRNLTWKLSKVVQSADPFACLNHLPGQQGIELAISAFRSAGAPGPMLDSVVQAVRRFGAIVDTHAGDREHFELTLESMGLYTPELRPVGGRELAFRGNSMIWGVQSRTRHSLAMIAPHPTEPGKADFLQVGGILSFRRLRQSARWRLGRLRASDDAGGKMSGVESLSPRREGDPPFLMREFCSPNMPDLELVDSPFGREFVLPGGPIGNYATFDCYFGFWMTVDMRRSPGNEHGSSAISVTLPTELLIADLIVHRDLPIARNPEFNVYGFPHGGLDDQTAQTVTNLLPIRESPIELAGSPPAVATPKIPHYGALLRHICEHKHWNLNEFWGVRVQVSYPPMSSIGVTRWPLR